jgi:xylan 1,4-beta-xylosidase
MFGHDDWRSRERHFGRAYKLRTVVDSCAGFTTLTDIYAMATKQNNGAAIIVWNYHDDDLAGDAEKVAIRMTGHPNRTALVQEFRSRAQ